MSVEAGRLPSLSERVIDDFNARATWHDILSPLGWSLTATKMNCEHWASANNEIHLLCGGVLMVASGQGEAPFSLGRHYTKFESFRVANGLCFTQALVAIQGKGYGSNNTEVNKDALPENQTPGHTNAASQVQPVSTTPQHETFPPLSPRQDLRRSLALAGAYLEWTANKGRDQVAAEMAKMMKGEDSLSPVVLNAVSLSSMKLRSGADAIAAAAAALPLVEGADVFVGKFNRHWASQGGASK